MGGGEKSAERRGRDVKAEASVRESELVEESVSGGGRRERGLAGELGGRLAKWWSVGGVSAGRRCGVGA